MTVAEKIKQLRKEAGLSQEKLADKLGVSRQAVTKWETDGGLPDIENLKTISAFFGISVDELISEEKAESKAPRSSFESITEYDIDRLKHYDINLGGAKAVILSGNSGEKLRVRLSSDTIETLQSDFKVKIDDIKRRIDIDLNRKNGITEAEAREALTVTAELPIQYMGDIELSANAKTVELHSIESEDIQLDIKSENLLLDNVTGTVEVNCNLDMNIICQTLNGSVEINQTSSCSKITVPENTPFRTVIKGMGTSISYEQNGEKAADFSTEGAENVIELNGIKSELVICRG